MLSKTAWVCLTALGLAVILAATFLIYTGTHDEAQPGLSQPPSFLNGPVSVGSATDQPGLSWLFPGGNRTEGFDADFARWLGDHSSNMWRPSLSPVAVDDRVSALQSNRVKLVIQSFSITDERLREIDMAGPYLVTHQGVMVRSGDLSFKTPESLTGRDVCTIRGSTSEKELKRRNVNVSSVSGVGECITQLQTGQADAASTDQLILYGYAQRTPGLYVEPSVRFGYREEYGIGLPIGTRQECRYLSDQIAKFINSPEWDSYFGNAFKDLNPSNYKPTTLNPCKVR